MVRHPPELLVATRGPLRPGCCTEVQRSGAGPQRTKLRAGGRQAFLLYKICGTKVQKATS